jgi:DNA repair exonuclease SbcCD ATPase subunit
MVQDLRKALEQSKGELKGKRKALAEAKSHYKELGNSLKLHEKAREIINQVAQDTQQQLQYHISDITSLALESVFTDPYKLVVDFVERRNKTECDIIFEKAEQQISPLDASGYGAVDVASLALRVACWSMKFPRTRHTLILDEPFRFLSRDKQEMASIIKKEISDKLEIQFIIVTHEETLAKQADKTFNVKIQNKRTAVE